MISFGQTKNIRETSGDPLPSVWKGFDAVGFQFIRGQLVLIVAGPGTGKSALTLSYAIQSGISTLYFSADSDAFTQHSRAISMVTGQNFELSKKQVRDNVRRTEVENLPIWFSYAAAPTLDDIEGELDAMYERDASHPDLIVVDNITNVVSGFAGNDEDPFGGLEALMDWLHEKARKTGACVIGLHHVKSDYNNGDRPIPISGIKGQIARVPEAALTLHKRPAVADFQDDTLVVSVVKNRNGRMDPSGDLYAELTFDGDRMQITD